VSVSGLMDLRSLTSAKFSKFRQHSISPVRSAVTRLAMGKAARSLTVTNVKVPAVVR